MTKSGSNSASVQGARVDFILHLAAAPASVALDDNVPIGFFLGLFQLVDAIGVAEADDERYSGCCIPKFKRGAKIS